MNNKVKKTSILVAAVASFAITAGAVSAQPGPDGQGQGGRGGAGGGGRPPMEQPFGQPGEAPFRQDGEHPGRNGIDLLKSIAEASGLTVVEIRQQLQDGATIDELLAEAGTSLDAIIDQALADGLLTETQAEHLKAHIASGDFSLGGIRGGRDFQPVRNAIRGTIEAAAELTGLDVAEIRAQIRDGETLEDILEANGSSGDALVAVVITQAEERLNGLVEAGKITAEQAETRLEALKTRLTERLN